jgi:NADH-quinone oxidoreductase subunit C
MIKTADSLKEKLSSIQSFSGMTFSEIYNYPCLEVPKEKILEISGFLKNDLGLDLLVDLFGIDRFTKENRFEVVYNLWSLEDNYRIFMRVKLDSKKPEIDSVSSVWETANWEEREAYDMFGINFINHPDLRRMYMTEDFKFYPLRKDFPLMGIPGTIELPKK